VSGWFPILAPMSAAQTRLAAAEEASLIYVIGRVNQGILRLMRARLSQFELSVQEYTALSILRARPGLSNAQLARRSLVTPQSMIEILAKLEGRGLVLRKKMPRHGRVLHAKLTASGRRLLAKADPGIQGIQDELLADVPAAEQAMVLQVMRGAMATLSGPRRDE
jgi:DNA-binding MarR family transcriptional regulator